MPKFEQIVVEDNLKDGYWIDAVDINGDGRLIVDLRWFGIVEPRADSRVYFSDTHADSFGMPRLTFEWQLSDEDRRKQHRMMADMLRA
jgi:hypothetical protein